MEARNVIDSVERLEEAIARVRKAQKEFATYTQEQVDKIFFAAAVAANKMRIPLAKLAVEETGMGIVEDKTIMRPSISTTRTRTPKPAELSTRTRHTAQSRLPSLSDLWLRLSPPQTPRPPQYSKRLFRSKRETASSSALTQERKNPR